MCVGVSITADRERGVWPHSSCIGMLKENLPSPMTSVTFIFFPLSLCEATSTV